VPFKKSYIIVNNQPIQIDEKGVSMSKIVRFPETFQWGAATAAHQVEGNNVNCDAWVLEHLPHSMYVEPSGDSIDHYHHYEDDIAHRQCSIIISVC
jgi:hypothetical protein